MTDDVMPPDQPPYQIKAPYYPIVYVRGYAMTASEREDTFYDTYYGFSATSVEKREAPPKDGRGGYFETDVFEGQMIRLMKLKHYSYADSANSGLSDFYGNPARSIWVCRFYDEDFYNNKTRDIEDHARDLDNLIRDRILNRLLELKVGLGPENRDYKVILIAHSMGGLICRTLIQNILPAAGEDPKRWVHRLVTLGTPHGGIELSAIPDFLEGLATKTLNLSGSRIFNTDVMKKYLKLPKGHAAQSLGNPKAKYAFPVKRCLCIIGSDHGSYMAVKAVTGGFSDGLVKQDRAYVVAGPEPADGEPYPPDRVCYWANVHRAHSGRRGIVNSYESYENIQRFLFGDTRVLVRLDDINVRRFDEENEEEEKKEKVFYDFEFLYSVRNTGVYLHRYQQDPCENAQRVMAAEIPKQLILHTGFMNSSLRDKETTTFSHFSIKLRVVEHRVKGGFLWDKEYPDRPIYNETIEIQVGATGTPDEGKSNYRWLSDVAEDWTPLQRDDHGVYGVALRASGALSGRLSFVPSSWPDRIEAQD